MSLSLLTLPVEPRLDIDSVHWKLVEELGGYRIVPSDDAVMTQADMICMMRRMVACMNKLRGIPTDQLSLVRSTAFSKVVAGAVAHLEPCLK